MFVLFAFFKIPAYDIKELNNREKNNEDNSETNQTEKPFDEKKIRRRVKRLTNWGFFFFGIMMLPTLLNVTTINIALTYLVIFCAMVFVLIFEIDSQELFKELGLIIIFILFIFLVLGLGLAAVENIKKGEFNGTTIQTKTKTYIATDSLIYVKKTSDFTFFYNNKLKYAEVIPNSEIIYSKIVIKKRPKRSIWEKFRRK